MSDLQEQTQTLMDGIDDASEKYLRRSRPPKRGEQSIEEALHEARERLGFLADALRHITETRTVATEVSWMARLATASAHPDIHINVILGLDLPVSWWSERSGNLLEGWFREFNCDERAFRQKNGITG